MNTSLLLCFAVAVGCASAVSVPLRQNPETICIGQENFLRIASENSCLHYFQCYADRAYLMQCPIATWFNENEQICDNTDPPVGCTVDLEPNPIPEPEPEPDEETEDTTEETEDSEEETESSEDVTEEPEGEIEESEENVEETDTDSNKDGSGDFRFAVRDHYYEDKGLSKERKETALENKLIELFKTLLIKLQNGNNIDLEDEQSRNLEETLVEVIRNYRNIKLEEDNYEKEKNKQNIQVEGNKEGANKNIGVVKFMNAYQVYKQQSAEENDAQYVALEDEDLIKIENQLFVDKLRQKRQVSKSRENGDLDEEDAPISGEEGNEGDKEENGDNEEETKVDNNGDENTDEGNEDDGDIKEPLEENGDQEDNESPSNQENNAKANGKKKFHQFFGTKA